MGEPVDGGAVGVIWAGVAAGEAVSVEDWAEAGVGEGDNVGRVQERDNTTTKIRRKESMGFFRPE
jgi:hypothetical protein